MTERPLVSIIIPTYNRHSLLAELLECLVRQTFINFEVIIVNDGGRTVDEIVRLYHELNCTIIDFPINQDHVHARNTGVEIARGEYIMPIDDDDLIVPSHLARMLLNIQEADLVYSDVEIIDYEQLGGNRNVRSRQLFAYHHSYAHMRTFSTFVPSGCLYRRVIHEQIGLFDPEVKNYWDWDFYLRVAQTFRIKRVEVAGVLYNFSTTTNNASKDLSSMRMYLDRLSAKHGLGELPTKNFFLLLEEPEMKAREAKSEVIWDGIVHSSRLTQEPLEM
ncbi:glycosyltransferase family 2 protein [Bacillus suaedae]|uniref:Glycosyltransferase family 2 protein n=1 Tax=Halalkalibacter suaedae TaxID=2822140 RepID=A0A940X0F8_9BACI|nr:glycosyltransferase family 2 protein [Bacillus suaedae]